MQTFADQAVIAIENVRLFDEIQDKSRQLAEASQHKSQFLANMSHELRTPLNAILGYTELIADGIYGAPPEKMQAVLKRVESNGRHLLGLINAVLDLSKIEAGQFTLDLADYSLQNVAQTVYNAVEPLAADKKLAFKAEVQPDLPPGRGDERRLTQVLLNLVGNAIKFTDAGEVVIKADASNGSFNVSVRDTGPGISAADQAKLFQEFQQADNSKTRKKDGTGLGLAISKRIIEMHGGRIWIELQVGQGSTFFVTLPVQAQAASPRELITRPHVWLLAGCGDARLRECIGIIARHERYAPAVGGARSQSIAEGERHDATAARMSLLRTCRSSPSVPADDFAVIPCSSVLSSDWRATLRARLIERSGSVHRRTSMVTTGGSAEGDKANVGALSVGSSSGRELMQAAKQDLFSRQ